MFLSLIFAAFVAFPESIDAILANTKKEDIEIETSGSLGLFHYDDNKCHQTYGNDTLLVNEKKDWCSNIKKGEEDIFIQYSLKGKLMKINKYSVRNGCCRFPSCCLSDGTILQGSGCCCWLYGYSLKASKDKRTWKTLHKVENDDNFYGCKTKTFELTDKTPYKYYMFVLDQEYPNCIKCMQINQIEFYGETIKVDNDDFDDIENDDYEPVSIIGKVRTAE